MDSSIYTSPLNIDESLTIKAKALTADGKASRLVTKHFTKVKPIKQQKIGKLSRGLRYKIYQGNWHQNKEDFIHPKHKTDEGILPFLTLDNFKINNEFWAIEINGYFKVNKTDTYTFYGFGSRGLDILVDGITVIKREHELQGVIQLVLEEGYHKIYIKSFQRNWRKALGFGYWDELYGRIPFTPFEVYHEE